MKMLSEQQNTLQQQQQQFQATMLQQQQQQNQLIMAIISKFGSKILYKLLQFLCFYAFVAMFTPFLKCFS